MKNWENFGKPIVVLVVICLITSALLGVTNEITKPIIATNEAKVANDTRSALLPEADGGFEKQETTVAGVTEMYVATNGAGAVVTAEAQGYGGAVPVMVAFTSDGTIKAVQFLANSETAGLGQKVRSAKFQDQFAGMAAESFSLSDIDAVTGATISSGAAVTAINAAIDAYMGNVELTPEERCAKLLPDAGTFTAMDAASLPDKVTAVYTGANGGTVIWTAEEGFYKASKPPITAAVAFNDDGTIAGVWFDASNETSGKGQQVSDDKSFAESFKGLTSVDGVDTIAGATISSTAAKTAVGDAVAAFAQLKKGA